MKKSSFIFSVYGLLAIFTSRAQIVQYQYDAAGNRVSRELMQPSMLNSSNESSITFTVFPTVVTDVININTQDDISPTDFNYSISNVSGNTFLSGTILSKNTQIKLTLPQGYYILCVFSAQELYYYNFLVR